LTDDGASSSSQCWLSATLENLHGYFGTSFLI
jgi:hypothetical protein